MFRSMVLFWPVLASFHLVTADVLSLGVLFESWEEGILIRNHSEFSMLLHLGKFKLWDQ